MAFPDPKGYRRLSPRELEARGLKPRSRGVLAPTGEVISRRQFENLRIRKAGTLSGWDSWSQFQAARNSPVYKYDMELALKRHPDVTAKDMRKIDSEFNVLFSEAKHFWNKRKSPEYRDPNGPVANFLVYLGLRDENATYDVGETQPK